MACSVTLERDQKRARTARDKFRAQRPDREMSGGDRAIMRNVMLGKSIRTLLT